MRVAILFSLLLVALVASAVVATATRDDPTSQTPSQLTQQTVSASSRPVDAVVYASTCKLISFPNQVRAYGPDDVRQMTARQVGLLDFVDTENIVDGVTTVHYVVTAQLLKPINPRLCRWQVLRNENQKLYFDEGNLKRFPLNPEKMKVSVRCMTGRRGEIQGRQLEVYPQFSRSGSLAPVNSDGALHPLCGDLLGLRAGQMLEFKGNIDVGVSRMLECQSAEPADARDWVMHPIFTIDCTGKVPPASYATIARRMRREHRAQMAEEQAKQAENDAAKTTSG